MRLFIVTSKNKTKSVVEAFIEMSFVDQWPLKWFFVNN